jgi:hypothetical protein
MRISEELFANKNRRFTWKAPVPDWDQERLLFDRPGHIGYGGGGPFAETFVRIGRPSAR